jgi:ABC-type phosphate transport system substrate-binding protein
LIRLDLFVGLVLVAVLAAGCGASPESPLSDEATSELSGRIGADGSTRLGPFMTAAAERFQEEFPNVSIAVGFSGTSAGFERFCAGETELSNASRPISDTEAASCEEHRIGYLEFHVVNDARSRPLFVYANEESFARREVAAFVGYALANGPEIAAAAGAYISLTAEQMDQVADDFDVAVSEVGPYARPAARFVPPTFMTFFSSSPHRCLTVTGNRVSGATADR